MNRILIPREDWEIWAGFPLPIVFCPGCKSGLLGNSTHRIQPNGEVNNSVICPSCGFHDFVTLENYESDMAKTKQDYVNQLVKLAFRLDEKAAETRAKTSLMQRAAQLARDGKQDTEEFKKLKWEIDHPTVVDSSNEFAELEALVKQLRKFKWE